MQHIGVRIQDAEGKTVQEPDVNFADVMKVVYESPDYKNKWPLLASIDPYDDTMFNSLVVPQLIDELSTLPQDIEAVRESISFLKKVEQFQGVEFLGD
ncbi:MAG TPA: hypothetical protein VMU25_00175 [Candidatus Paceibacterota bacterium]|nr:hypothetical protein [Candidatus Paceibacterota bacterium]